MKDTAVKIVGRLLAPIRSLLPPRNSVRVIIAYANHIALVRELGVDYWSLPGGKIHSNETPEACAVREIQEELGVTAQGLTQLGEYHFDKGARSGLVTVYVMQARNKTLSPSREISQSKWFSLDNLPQNLGIATAERIREYHKGATGLRTHWLPRPPERAKNESI